VRLLPRGPDGKSLLLFQTGPVRRTRPSFLLRNQAGQGHARGRLDRRRPPAAVPGPDRQYAGIGRTSRIATGV